MRRLEAVCDAVARYHDYWNPESEAYELRNPLVLLGPDGKRRFSCHRAGYASGMDKVMKFCRAHPDDTLDSLLEYLGIKMKRQQEEAIDFISRCSNSTVNSSTNLHWCLEEVNAPAPAYSR